MQEPGEPQCAIFDALLFATHELFFWQRDLAEQPVPRAVHAVASVVLLSVYTRTCGCTARRGVRPRSRLMGVAVGLLGQSNHANSLCSLLRSSKSAGTSHLCEPHLQAKHASVCHMSDETVDLERNKGMQVG